MALITPVLLAGGSGTRLWPLSRKSYPKQFSKLIGDHSLFQNTAMRFSTSDSVKFLPPITMTTSEFRFIVAEQLRGVNVDPGAILIEPSSKNTGPAILAASLYAYQNDPDAILLVSPSDHVVPDVEAFHQAISRGIEEIVKEKIVTFGVEPTQPETGYGYMECCEASSEKAVRVLKFVEKPSFEIAQEFLLSKRFLWNAGIFLFRAKDILGEFRTHSKDLLDPTLDAVKKAKVDLGFLRLNVGAWEDIKNVSIDYAVLEHSTNLVAIPFAAGWSDVGDWNSVWQEQYSCGNGVASSKNVTAIDCSDCLIRSEHDGQHVVGLGLNDLIVVAMPDAVLVAQKSRSQEVREVVASLKSQGVNQAEISFKDHRPWGWFENLVEKEKFKVKRIVVNPGASLSLQSHKYRSEHWVVVVGTAKVTINGVVTTLKESESVYVPMGAIHKLENPGEFLMELVEVQTGTYLGEDDIFRYEDMYMRC